MKGILARLGFWGRTVEGPQTREVCWGRECHNLGKVPGPGRLKGGPDLEGDTVPRKLRVEERGGGAQLQRRWVVTARGLLAPAACLGGLVPA